MSIQQDFQLRPHVDALFTATGVIGPAALSANMTGNLRVVVENVGGGNTIQVQGRLHGQTAWVTLDTIVGPSSGATTDISVVDEVRFNCTVYAASGAPKLIASGFFPKASGGGGGGSINDGANIGVAGVGVYDSAVGDTLNFRNINSSSPEITVTLDAPNFEVDIGFDGSALDVFSLGGMGTFNNSKFTGTNSVGDLESIQAWDRNAFDGAEVTQNLTPVDVGSTTFSLNRKLTNITPTADITDNYFQDADYMQVNSAFDLNNFVMKEFFLEYLGSGSIQNVNLQNYFLNLGQGGVPSSSGGTQMFNSGLEIRDDHTTGDVIWLNSYVSHAEDAVSNSLSVMNIGMNVSGTVTTNVNGISYSPNIQSTASINAGTGGVSLFYANPGIDATIGNLNGFLMNGFGSGLVSNFLGFSAVPSFPVTNYTGVQVGYNGSVVTSGFTGLNAGTNADVDNFNGVLLNYNGNVESYWNGFSISGTWTMDPLTNFQGVIINPTITGDAQSAIGVSVNMDNVTVFAGVASSLVEQDLTFTSNEVGTGGDSISLEYTGGGTAGSEVVSVTVNAIEVQIEDGVSTATQIKAAIEAEFQANLMIDVTISGVGGNAQNIFGPTNLAGGINAGTKEAANFNGDVSIDGDLSFTGALSIGQLNAFASQAIVTGTGTPASIHGIISNMTLADNLTVTSADTIGTNTAALIVLGANCSVSTDLLGLAALALPAVVSLGAATTVDEINGAAYALALQGGGAGTITDVGLCKTVCIPNGTTTVTNLKMFWAQLPFGDPGTNSWGVYAEDVPNNYMEGNLVVGTSDLPTNSSVGIEIVSTTKAMLLSRMDSTEETALTAVNGMIIYNTTTNKFRGYENGTWVDIV